RQSLSPRALHPRLQHPVRTTARGSRVGLRARGRPRSGSDPLSPGRARRRARQHRHARPSRPADPQAARTPQLRRPAGAGPTASRPEWGPNVLVSTVTTALSGELQTELRFFGFSYRMPVGELDPVWPRTLMALRQKAPVIDGQRWRLATDVAVERIEVLDVETGEVIVMVRGGFVPA